MCGFAGTKIGTHMCPVHVRTVLRLTCCDELKLGILLLRTDLSVIF